MDTWMQRMTMNAPSSISQFMNNRLLTYILAPFLRQKLNKEYSIIIIIIIKKK